MPTQMHTENGYDRHTVPAAVSAAAAEADVRVLQGKSACLKGTGLAREREREVAWKGPFFEKDRERSCRRKRL